MNTHVIRIKLEGNISKAIQDECALQWAVGCKLATCFTHGTDLVLIFQDAAN